MIPKGIASPGLLSYIITSTFCDALPYYRQEKMFARIGIDIPRSTMCAWAIVTARQCEPLVELVLFQYHRSRSKEIALQFHAWLTKRAPQVPPSKLLGKAIQYTLGQ